MQSHSNLRLLPLALLLFSVLPSFGHAFVVYFEKDASALSASEQQRLDVWIRLSGLSPGAVIVLRGHADSDAGSAHNLELSARRNASVEAVLLGHQLKPSESKAYGESWPACRGTSEDCLRENRRVELIVLPEATYPLDVERELTVPQVFFGSSRDSLICVGAQETKLELPPGIFVRKDGSVPDSYRVELKEYTKISDCILAGLTTQTHDGRLLETGGMVNIQAFSGADTLMVNQNVEFQIVFPPLTKEKANNMILFTGLLTTSLRPVEFRRELVWFVSKKTTRTVRKTDDGTRPAHPVVDLTLLINGTSEGDTVMYHNRTLVMQHNRNKDRNDLQTLEQSEPRLWYCNPGEDVVEIDEVDANAADDVIVRQGVNTEYVSLQMPARQVGWFNCDRLINAPRRDELAIRGVPHDYTAVYAILNESKTITTPLYDQRVDRFLLPENSSGFILSFSAEKDGYLFDAKPFGAGSSSVILTPELISKDALSARLSRFNL
jgi:hypothetical protein